MKFRIFILLVFLLPAFLYVSGKPGDGNKNKDKDKGKISCKQKAKAQYIANVVFMLPAPAKNNTCQEKKDLHVTVVNFYKWYLQNEDRISSGLSHENKGKDLIPPFNISWQTLHEYFEVIQTKYADWITDIHPNPEIPSTVISRDADKATVSGGSSAPLPAGAAPTINFSNMAK
jgi:hypothetical protein